MELAAAYYDNQAHYSDDLTPRSTLGLRPGRSGNALCSWVQVFDAEAIADEVRRGNPHSLPTDLASLPVCPRCVKKSQPSPRPSGGQR